jgi:4-amino-4-deoxy-L-arabinose transferase-like glycosyltransferase
VLALALYLPWLGFTDLMHEETRRAVIARTMMQNGDFLVPLLGERIYLNKPPLFNWMIVSTSLPFGTVTEWSARLVTVLSLALLAATMVLAAGHRLGAAARWLLGIGTIVAGEIMHKAVLANVDIAFTLFVSASLWVWFALDDRGRRGLALWLPPAVLVAAAVLIKREPGLVFYYLGIGAFLLTQRRFGELFRPAHLTAAAVTLALIAAWLVPLIEHAGLAAFLANVEEQVLDRGVSAEPAEYVKHFFLFPLEIMVASLPVSILLAPLAWPSVRRAVRLRHGRMFLFALVVVLVNLPVYWLRADAAVRYFLPMFPTLAVIAAMVFDTLACGRERWPRGAVMTLYALSILVSLLAVGFGSAMTVLSVPGLFPEIAGPIVPWPLMLVVGLATIAAIVYPAIRDRRDAARLAFIAVVGFGVAMRITEIGFRIPYEAQRIREENDDVPAILDRIREELPPGVEKVQAIGKIHHAFWFYDRENLIVPLARLERSGEPASAYLLSWEETGPSPQWADLERRLVARIPYADGDMRLTHLTGPIE